MSAEYGKFSESPKTEWLDEAGDDRGMRLLEDFWYDDPDGNRWCAPAGSVIDGASIPSPLWSIVGSPYTGAYRRASVVHDVACDDPDVARKDADRMFYYACLAGGCSKRQARLLYAGVRIGAWTPRIRVWSEEAVRAPALQESGVTARPTDVSVRTAFDEIAEELESQPETLPFEEVERIVDRQLEAKSRQ
jgi:hypothetical protein